MLPVRILIVDSNIVYAKKVSAVLERFINNVEVDIAQDVWVTKRRLKQYHYDLVIADIDAVVAQDILVEELRQSNVPTIAWTVMNSQEVIANLVNVKQIFDKPHKESEMCELLQPAISLANRRT